MVGFNFRLAALIPLDTTMVTTIITTATTEAWVQSPKDMACWYIMVASTRVSVPPRSWGVV